MARLKELIQAARQYLAWESIWEDRETLNLDEFQRRQAETKRKASDDTISARIPETYQWLLVPKQDDPKGAIEWAEIRLQGQDSLAARAAKKLKTEELLLTQLGGTRLRFELDRVPLWRGNHVGVKQLIDDFAQYLYLPRLKNSDVLSEAIQGGAALLTWQTETFAYAEGWDEARRRYVGLQAGQQVKAVIADGRSLIVKPELAAAQAAEAARPAPSGVPSETGASPARPGATAGETSIATGPQPTPAKPKQPCRFHGAIPLDSARIGPDAGRIAEEVVQHLSRLVDSRVEVILEIHADIPYGVPDHIVRTVTENCRTLKFQDHGFEDE